ncbi:MAG TPA: hypothetical protein VJN67_21720 [Stellaceae bacterium]|nr:hypothetical protein [Stellaceae bacterium]
MTAEPDEIDAARPVGGAAKRGASATVAMALVAVLAVTALPLCILLLTGLVPTMVATVVDRYRARYLTRAVGFMNLAGLTPLIVQLWANGLSMDGVAGMLSRPINWLTMYGAAGIGWVLFLGMPSLARIFVDIRADQLQRDLHARAKHLVEEWGEEVTGKAKPGS